MTTNTASGSRISFYPPTQTSRTFRLMWLMALRVGLISTLLSATIFFEYRSGGLFNDDFSRFLLTLIGITYVFTVGYALWYRTGKHIHLLAKIQLALDLLFWGCVTYATGGIISGFTFLFDLWIIVAAVLLGGRAAFFAAVGSVIVLSSLVGLMAMGILSPLSMPLDGTISPREYAYFITVNVVALCVVAVLVNSLVVRLEKTDAGLVKERTIRADLTQLNADMIRSLSVGLTTTDSRGLVMMMNPAGKEMLNIQDEDIEGLPAKNWFPEIFSFGVVESSARIRGRGTACVADNPTIPIEYIVAPLLRANGTRQGSIIVFSDLTEVQRLEEEVERTQRLAALGELAASLAHEIRNPLGAVSGAFQILASAEFNAAKETTDLVAIISKELRRMEHLVSDMLDYARPRSGNFTPVNINNLLSEVTHMFLLGQPPEHAVVDSNLAATQGIIARIDSSQIRQVIWNVLRNAIQATTPNDHIEIVTFLRDDTIEISVLDTGHGITEKDIEKIFDPFHSTRERGIGLGLALCRRIMKSHGGNITAENRPSGGSIFRVTLRRHRDDTSPMDLVRGFAAPTALTNLDITTEKE